MPHLLFGPEVRLMLANNDADGLRTFCESLHPATVAQALDDDEFTIEEMWQVLRATDLRTQAAVFEYLPIDKQMEMAEGPARLEVSQLIEKMSHDDRVDLLRRLPEPVQEGLLRLVDEADRKDIATLFEYGDGTVGSIMTTDYAWLPPNITAGDAIEQLRQQAPDRETIYYIFVLGEPVNPLEGRMSPRKLLGVISLRDVILAPRRALLQDIMERDQLVTVHFNDDQEKAADLLASYDFIAMPVVDNNGCMVGIVTHDDVIDVIREEATEDMQRQAGVSPLVDEYLKASFASVWKKRTVWLSLLFVAEMLTFSAMAHFEDAIDNVKILAYFVPLCIATGGNSGTQAATLVTRALALGQISVGDWFRVLRHELFMGLAMSTALGLIAFIRSLLVPTHMLIANGEAFSHARLGLVLGQAVMAICLFGTLMGSMLPLVFKKLGIDPAVASSPFVATAVDVTGIVIYFMIASAYLL